MTGLLKHDSGAWQTPIARFTGRLPICLGPAREDEVSSGDESAAELAIERHAAERATLESEIQSLRERIDEAAKFARTEVAAAFSNGRDAGLAEARDGDDRRIAVLEEALERARAEFEAKDTEVEALAIAIARNVLAKILGERETGARHVEAAVACQMEQIDPAEVRKVRVSAADFADAPVSSIAAKFPDVSVHRDSDLAAGECVIELELGCIEVSPLEQLARADAHLAALAEERRPET